MHGIRQTVPPAIEPVTLTLAKLHLRLDADFTLDDTLIGLYISAAREHCERYTNTLDHFPWPWGCGGTLPTRGRDFTYQLGPYIEGLAIRLPKPRTLAVTSIQYFDSTNTLQTLDPASYYLDIYSEPARIVPVGGFAWPIQDLYQPGSVVVIYTADGSDLLARRGQCRNHRLYPPDDGRVEQRRRLHEPHREQHASGCLLALAVECASRTDLYCPKMRRCPSTQTIFRCP
jgi:hypothetical protein